ncbi:dihydroxyacetone kinase subunit DhaK [Nocardia sp. NRRL WC-3656]|uniref:dihydroxyacetone kinase subunit DhaK n=1 Tax=Nocardia sp. NRRL WC-3656 TaxID=1463824 RepID=UPI0018CC4996|nr:dihydroxyacetone kinase subunit DhaK [Nocardia sp. NRRL WC-3656]
MPALFLHEPGQGPEVSLRGFVRRNPWVRITTDPLFVHHDRGAPTRRVALVSGGGSGHEPMHVGFVGMGMLDAAVPGKIFASPHNRQVYEASKAVARAGGVLHIVKNYTGDKINFGIAAERLAADGIEVGRVLVDDDVATESDETATGRRGTAATIIVEKILGAAADRGDTLTSLTALGREVAAHSRSIAVATEALTSPNTGARAFELEPDQLEYGVGIHGERASTSITRPPLAELVDRMLTDILASLPGDPRKPLLLLINGLGATTELELCTVLELAARTLTARGREISAVQVGTFVAALDMSGFSITLTQLADGWLDLWHAPTGAPAWKDTAR